MKKGALVIGIIFWAAGACKEVYTPPLRARATNYLVVEGFINNGADTTYIRLSRTFPVGVSDPKQAPPELNAKVEVQGHDNSVYPLSEMSKGLYIAPGLNLNAAIQYRLHIQTADAKNYFSDWLTLKTSPPIDSINWQVKPDGSFQVFTNTHDPANASRFYRWDYVETWEFTAIYETNLVYLPQTNSITFRIPDLIDTCWKSDTSSALLLGSSAASAQDLIYEAPLVSIPPMDSWHISYKYSILVKQYVLSADAYNFWLDIQKNNTDIGTIFSAEPSGSHGNIHNPADNAELVVGYMSAGTLSKLRMYVRETDIPIWNHDFYTDQCKNLPLTSIAQDQPDSIRFLFKDSVFMPYYIGPGTGPGDTVYYYVPRICADCTLAGTNHKPWFWQ